MRMYDNFLKKALACILQDTQCNAELLGQYCAKYSNFLYTSDSQKWPFHPLELAILHGTSDHLKVLLFYFSHMLHMSLFTHPHNSLMMASIEYGKPEFVRILYRQDSDFGYTNSNGDSLLHFASRSGCFEIVRLVCDIVQSDSFVNNNNETPLFQSVLYKQNEVAAYLIHKDNLTTTVNIVGVDMLQLIVVNGWKDLLCTFLNNAPRMQYIAGKIMKYQTPLLSAMQMKQTDIVQILLDAKQSVFEPNVVLEAPFYVAMQKQCAADVAEMILKAGKRESYMQ
jgi:ankyrin repeat protein